MADAQGSSASVSAPISQTEDEPAEMLLERECGFTSRRPDEPSDWLSSDRRDSVQWIREMTDRFGFAPKTAYLAVTYLDRFLVHTHERDSRMLRMVAVACFLLAAKVEEIKPPALSMFQSRSYNKNGAFAFCGYSIRRAERRVLSALDWRMCSVTPFAYLGYFASKLGIGTDDLLSRATKLIFEFAGAMGVVDYRPSTVAFAAILAAFDQTSTEELVESKIGAISLPGSFETDKVFPCYALMIKKT